MTFNNKNAIEVQDLSKIYRLGEVGTGTISHDLKRWWYKLMGKEDPFLKFGELNRREQQGGDYVWALKDVNFEVKQGDVMGIVGKNGAGKSTLLKILSRVTAPTTGTLKAKGRIASLLEVGTGFHPELTGRENVFLNGAILGMTKQEIRNKFDEIVAFSGVERYIDTPVKRYSSGMYVRLAFGVAAHLESEILIVDEVLAVGDAEFQQKCLGKMKDISTGEGRTVLFVSHNMGAVRNLCNQAILMQHGTVVKQGDTPEIIDAYLSGGTDGERILQWEKGTEPQKDELTVNSIRVIDDRNRLDNIISNEEALLVEISYHLSEPVRELRVTVSMHTSDGVHVFSSSDYLFQPKDLIRKAGNHQSICKIPARFLNAGAYTLTVDFDIPMSRALIMGLPVRFNVTELFYNQLGKTISSKPPGVIHPYLDWTIQSS
jgi:lipopolysaccharide transport system ATP-binding protein